MSVDRSEAVNLARDWTTRPQDTLTSNGIFCLAEAVLRMDEALRASPSEAESEADKLLRDYYAAYPHGRLGERARALLGAPYPTVPCRSEGNDGA